MPSSWAKFGEYLSNIWKNMTLPQKVILIAAPLAVMVSLTWLVVWASRPAYVPIFTNLPATEAGAIKKKLDDLKIQNYKLADNGSTILVPQDQAATIRLDLANSGLPQGSKFSFDNSNQIRLGETDADRKLRYLLGLQDELETTLKTLAGVENARVHLTMPEPSLYTDTEKEATAAVTLMLAPTVQMKEEQVRAVANLLASSVEGLKPENVTIVDTNGNDLSEFINNSNEPERLTGTQLQLQQSVEKDIEKQLRTMLEHAFGSGKVVVRANVVLDFDLIKIIKQTKDPGTLVSKQTTIETTYEDAQANTGIQDGVQSYTSSAVYAPQLGTRSQSTENYEFGSTQEERTVRPGTIKRLTISVLADATIPTGKISEIRELVANAAGLDTARGDRINITTIPFDTSGREEAKKALAEAERNQRTLTYAKMGAAAFLALIFLLFLVFSRRRRPVVANVPDLAIISELQKAQAEAAVAGPSTFTNVKTPADLEKQKVNEAVKNYSQSNPEQFAKLIKAWLSEEN